MQVYRESELHSFRSGRTMDTDLFFDDFQIGAQKLREGKLKRWITKTTQSRGLQDAELIGPLLNTSGCMDLGNESDDDTEDMYSAEPHSMNTQIFGILHAEEGQLKFIDVDVESEARQIVQELDIMEGEGGENSDTDSEMSLDRLADADF